jgi:hydroxyacylglutathione hydrolase
VSPIRVESTADRQFGTNSYLVEDEETMDAVIIDANLEPELIVHLVQRRGAHVKAILLTHTDVDHIGGLARLLEAFDVPVAVHPAEKDVVTEGKPLRRAFPVELPAVPRVDLLEEGRRYRAGSLEFEVLHTPGHSPGGVTLRIENVLFTGDALFAGSIGRTDFPNSDTRALMSAIQDKLMAHDDEVIVYSGHGPPTTIGRERRYNPFL